jgi:hypothetical protein
MVESGSQAGRSSSDGQRARRPVATKEPGRRAPARMDGVSMTPHMKWAIGGIVVGLILLIVSPWLALAIIAAAIAIPTAAYLMLDESQRRRLRETRRRRQLGN